MRRGLGFHARHSPGGFNPASLFAGGVNGAWFDPSDSTTLFSDRAGTTPCGTPGGGSVVPVGLMLDKSQGLVLGSELFSTFGTVTAPWTAQGGGVWSIDGSQAGSRDLSQVAQYTVNRFYVTSFTLSGVTGGTVTVFAGEGSVGPTYGNGTFTIRSYSSQAYLIFRAPAGVAATVSGISVRELPGNHAIAANDTTARPELRARVNLLLRSEEFDNAYWARFSTSITTNAAIAPDGTTTADLLVPVTTGIDRWIYRGGFDSSVKTYSVYAKASGMSWMNLANSGGAGGGGVWFDLTNGVLGTVSAGFTASITSVGDGWYRCSTTQSGSNGANFIIGVCDSDNTRTATASGSNGIFIWGAQLTATNEFPANTYQRITDANTYDAVGFPRYFVANGTSSAMSTPGNVNLSGTDKVTVFAGVRKIGTGTMLMVETSADSSSNNGSLSSYVVTPGTQYAYASKGTAPFAAATTGAAAYTAPVSNVLTGISDISGDSVILRLNGAQIATNTADQGSGNYGTYPLFIGSRNNSTFFFNGNIYSLIVVGSAVSAGQISATEQWVAGKTGITI